MLRQAAVTFILYPTRKEYFGELRLTKVKIGKNEFFRFAGFRALVPMQRPDLARQASPTTYIDKNDPPFFIVQGEKDESVPYTQSQMLAAWLTVNGVPNQLTIVPGAPHYAVMFDGADIRKNLFAFLAAHL